MLNQQDHILSGKGQASRCCQRGGQGSIYKFTYELEMINETGWSEEWLVLNQQVHVRTGNEKMRQNDQRGGKCLTNKFTYILEIRKPERMVRGVIGAQSTSLRTN